MVFGIADVIKDYSFVFEKFLNNNHNCLLYFLIWRCLKVVFGTYKKLVNTII